MRKDRYSSRIPQAPCDALPLADLEQQAANWILDGDVRQLSDGTIFNRKLVSGKLIWFLRENRHASCGTAELRAFLAYLNRAHTTNDGRWGDPARNKPLRPAAAKFYYSRLQTFFNFLVEEGVLDYSPMATLKPPIVRQDQVVPFTVEQVESLLRAARKTRHPKRDEAILLMLFDTGLRASELCSLTRGDLDISGRRVTVIGKGNKRRTVYFGGTTTKALWAYLKADPRDADDPLFASLRGKRAGEPMTRYGLLQLFERLEKAAGLEGVRCSPHTARHTFGAEFARAGGSEFTLQQLFGHTTLSQTRRYVALAEADAERQHRAASPMDRMRDTGKGRSRK